MADYTDIATRVSVGSDVIRTFPGAVIEIYATGTSTPLVATATADVNGFWSIASLPTGHYDFKIDGVVVMTAHHVLSSETMESDKTFAFNSSGTSGTRYFGGYYKHSATINNFSSSQNFGTANVSYGGKFYVVTGAATVDELTIRITGTSITDAGVRTASDTEDIIIPDATSVDSYYQTAKNWIGQIAIIVQSGTATNCNYGFANYWSNSEIDFTVKEFVTSWLASATDTGPNIELLHHKATGWTYNSGSAATPPIPIVALQTDYNTEYQTVSGDNGSWIRNNLNVAISSSTGEGIIIKITSGVTDTFAMGNFLLKIETSI